MSPLSGRPLPIQLKLLELASTAFETERKFAGYQAATSSSRQIPRKFWGQSKRISRSCERPTSNCFTQEKSVPVVAATQHAEHSNQAPSLFGRWMQSASRFWNRSERFIQSLKSNLV